MGVSGILSNSLLHPKQTLNDPKQHWRWVWIASFSLAVNVYVYYLHPQVALHDQRSLESDVPIPSWPAYIIGGFLVGVGTRIGNGCTTGHGICGIARFSPRSFVATCTFTGMSILTQFVTSPLRKWASLTSFLRTSTPPYSHPWASALFTTAVCMAAIARPIPVAQTHEQQKEHAIAHSKSFGAALSGVLFALGLSISGMTKTSKIHDFLCLSGFANNTYDPTLMTVMASGIFASWLSYQMLSGWSVFQHKKALVDSPVCLPKGSAFSVPTNTVIDRKLVLGAAIFGTGWGLTGTLVVVFCRMCCCLFVCLLGLIVLFCLLVVGICPGPGLYAAAAGVVSALVAWIPSFLAGSYAGTSLTEYLGKKKLL